MRPNVRAASKREAFAKVDSAVSMRHRMGIAE